MTPPISILNHGPLSFVDTLPTDWQGKVLPGGSTFSYQGEWGTIVIQEYRTADWCIQYTVLRCPKKATLQWHEGPFLRLQAVQEGQWLYKRNAKKFHLIPGTANAVWAPGQLTDIRIAKDQEYILFHTLYTPEMVKQAVSSFPAEPIADESKSVPVTGDWQNAIQAILDAPYNEETCRFFFENRIRDILLYFLLRPGARVRYIGVTDDEVARVHQVDALLLKDITQWQRVRELARTVHMTEFKLKQAFKIVMGLGLFERLRQKRLEHAKDLLLYTDLQIKAIPAKVGYKSISGFEDAFKEKYGLPPLQYRKKFHLNS